VAVLAEPKDGAGLLRLDFAAEAWDGGSRPEPPIRVFGFWRAMVSRAGAKKRLLVDDAALVDLFEQLEGATEPRKMAFRYLLALVLVRKRLLAMEGTRPAKDGAPGVMLVRHKGTAQPPERGGDGPPHREVVDPGLDRRAMEEGTEELVSILADGSGDGR